MEELNTQRLMIRRFTANDWKDLYAYLSDETVVKFEPYEVLSENECKREATRRAKDPAFWAVCLKENGKLIGNLYFAQEQPLEFRTWELGYVFNSAYQGKGYATESCKALMAYAFASMHVRRIIAMCDPRNSHSWKLLERLQMRRESHMLKTGFFKRDADGNPLWHDTYQYALLEDEFAGLKTQA